MHDLPADCSSVAGDFIQAFHPITSFPANPYERARASNRIAIHTRLICGRALFNQANAGGDPFTGQVNFPKQRLTKNCCQREPGLFVAKRIDRG